MKLPEDPFMLLSMVNMKLRDGDYESLSELCESLGVKESELKEKLKASGFEYNEGLKQFR